MGFFVAEPILIDDFKISTDNAYITIRASYTQAKSGTNVMGAPMPMPGVSASPAPYSLVARYFIYATQDASRPLKEDWITLGCDTVPANPIAALYTEIKAQRFAGKTITDDA